jgi:multiple sugar transport system ATP-binding protein
MATRIVVLNGGRVEQVGTPAEIYDKPASAFVAGFMGAPPMNLLPAAVLTQDGCLQIRASGVEASLWEGAIDERAVLLGVRPERLRIVATHREADDPAGRAPTDARFAGRVIAVENLGSEEIAICKVGSTRVAMRGARPLGLSPGEELVLCAGVEDLMLFDAASGRRLVWVPDATNGRDPDRLPDEVQVATR